MSDEQDHDETPAEQEGSDELLSDDNLRLPESAHILVRLHAVSAGLERKRKEASIAVGEAALALQEAMQSSPETERPRRRLRLVEGQSSLTSPFEQAIRAQQQLREAQERFGALEEAQSWLEECVAHTKGERVLVEYYLQIEQALLDAGYTMNEDNPQQHTPWYDAMVEVLRRIEHVGIPEES
jgi:hypothetical protein